MYYIKNGLGKNAYFLAIAYSVLGILTVFGTGNATQVNTITTAIDSALFNYNLADKSNTFTINLVIGIIIAILVGLDTYRRNQENRKRDREAGAIHGCYVYHHG